jgi:hypothetical protein
MFARSFERPAAGEGLGASSGSRTLAVLHRTRTTAQMSSDANYCNLAYSAFACFSTGESRSASFQNARKSRYAARAFGPSPCSV